MSASFCGISDRLPEYSQRGPTGDWLSLISASQVSRIDDCIAVVPGTDHQIRRPEFAARVLVTPYDSLAAAARMVCWEWACMFTATGCRLSDCSQFRGACGSIRTRSIPSAGRSWRTEIVIARLTIGAKMRSVNFWCFRFLFSSSVRMVHNGEEWESLPVSLKEPLALKIRPIRVEAVVSL